MSSPIRYIHAGQLHQAGEQSVTTTLLQHLREHRHCHSVKEGCAEGDCGACTVVLAELQDGQLQTRSVNACLLPLAAVNGKAVFTADTIGSEAQPHPVQQKMVECHGSQCGFCTPGFIMSMWQLYLQQQNDPAPLSRRQIQHALSGNLCRCTGYRPIIDAMQAAAACESAPFPDETLKQALTEITPAQSFHYSFGNQHWFAPRRLQELLTLRASYPDATLIAGATDIGLWINKQFRELNQFIYTAEVQELRDMKAENDEHSIGAAVSLETAYQYCRNIWPELTELASRFASLPVRHAGTLGGNLANGSPIGDSMPWLIALGAEITLRNATTSRRLALENFYLAYQKKDLASDEVLCHIHIPARTEQQIFRVWKVSKRQDQDISAVCAAFSATLSDGRLSNVRTGFGGVAAIPARARKTEQVLEGQLWDEATLQRACTVLMNEFAPISDMRASAAYRAQLCVNLLRRFWLETSPCSSARDIPVTLSGFQTQGAKP